MDDAASQWSGPSSPRDQWSGPPCPRVLVLTREFGASIFVDHVCPLGRRLGIRPGGTLGQARAIAPNLDALPADELRDRALLHRLAGWALGFSPLVEPLEPDTLLIDITGCERLFGGEPSLARQAVEGIRRYGLHVRAAIADTIGAAYALAVYGECLPDGDHPRHGEHRRSAGENILEGSGIGDQGSGVESVDQSASAESEREAQASAAPGGSHSARISGHQSKIQNTKYKTDRTGDGFATTNVHPPSSPLPYGRGSAEDAIRHSPFAIRHSLIVPPGHTVSWLAPLPPVALRIDSRTAERLDMLGIRTIGDLLTLPRSTLPSRFGRELVLCLQQALGEVHEAVAARRPDAPPTVHVALEEPLTDGALLQQLASDLLGRLLAEVERHDAGLRRLECVVERRDEETKRRRDEGGVQSSALHTIAQPEQGAMPKRSAGMACGNRDAIDECEGRDAVDVRHAGAALRHGTLNPSSISRSLDLSISFSIGLARASRSRRHIGELLARRLEQVDCTAGVLGLRLTAREISPWRPGQTDLFDDRPPGDAEALGCLIDRIANRVGYQSILRPRLIDDHQPEMAYRYVSVGEAGLEEERHEATKRRDEETKRRRDVVQSSALPGEHRRPAGANTLEGSGIGDRGSGLESDDRSEREAQASAAPSGSHSVKSCDAGQSKIQNPKSKIDRAGDGLATPNVHSLSSPLPYGRGSAGPLPYSQGSAGDAFQHSPFDIQHSPFGPRPLRLLPNPAFVRVMALMPEGPPGWMHYAGVEHRILHAAGPERIETAWWRTGDVRRDYYRVTSATGEQFWIFRDLDTGEWRLHGVFT